MKHGRCHDLNSWKVKVFYAGLSYCGKASLPLGSNDSENSTYCNMKTRQKNRHGSLGFLFPKLPNIENNMI
jgi:hypothetical protein